MTWALSHHIFNKVFKRGTDPAFDEINLVGTHYEAYIGALNENIALLRSLEWKTLTLKGCDGTDLVAYFYDAGSDKTAIICHGYKSHYFGNTSIAGRYFYDRDYNLLLIVSRGHEKSGGEYITFGELEYRDLLLWIEKTEKELGYKKIVLYGVSLGCNTVIRTSEHIKSKAVRALILDCGFVNTRMTITTQVSGKMDAKAALKPITMFLATKVVIPQMRVWGKKKGFDFYNGDTRESMCKNQVPAFFIHGEKDKTVPVTDTKQNYNACKVKKELYIAKDAGHGAGFPAGGEELRDRLDMFLKELIG